MSENTQETPLLDALKTSFISQKYAGSDPHLRVQFLTNQQDKTKGEIKKVLSDLKDDLAKCDAFQMSVAFITQSGVTPLLLTLRELEKKGVRGKILTTDYNTFTDPAALRKLSEFKNIDLKFYRCKSNQGFHTKGFIFEQDETARIIVGSSNLTQSALTTNKEWNVELISKKDGEFISKIREDFDALWNDRNSKNVSEVIDSYTEEFKQKKKDLKRAFKLLKEDRARESSVPLTPNSMQKRFIANLLEFYFRGDSKAMLISATGTGKTYAAAFAVRRLINLNEFDWKDHGTPRPPIKKVLFLVHREQIAEQALKSFKRVLGTHEGRTYGLFSGNSKEKEGAFTFATIQSVSRPDTLHELSKESFDLIIIDEVHRAGAETYKRIMNYFKPQFWLGMTASPDRTDGFNIYELFDNNIAYEIRLQTALEEDLLCPFHYFGISDLKVNGAERENLNDFRSLEFKERVKHVITNAKFLGFSGDRVKGLIFVSTIEEGKALSAEMNAQGFNTIALDGRFSQQDRKNAIRLLTEDGDLAGHLDYIITVDIFNEGVDIPQINQVILLRPTQSPIIFIQQLGRGLRKAEGKEFVVIIDFIANYKNNYLIPIALSGDNSYQKDSMRKYVSVGTKLIPGASTVEFEEKVKAEILRSIDSARTNSIELLKNSYQILKHKLGRIPRLTDYEEHNGIDAIKFFENKTLRSYYNFLVRVEKENVEKLTEKQIGYLDFLSVRVGNAKRIEEGALIELLLNAQPERPLKNTLELTLRELYEIDVTEALIKNVFLVLSGQFAVNVTEANENSKFAVLEALGDGDFAIDRNFYRELKEAKPIFKDQIIQLAELAKQRFQNKYKERYRNTDLVLYETYTYADVCRLLNWPKNINAQSIGGYIYNAATKTFPVFVNYVKDKDAIAYEDHFESERILVALSKTKRSVDSSDADHIYKRTEADKENQIYLFVRKNKDDPEAKSFYFLGKMHAIGSPEAVSLPSKADPNQTEKAFKIKYKLETPVRSDIYDYITGD